MIPKLLKKMSSEEPYYTQQTIYNHEKHYVIESQTPSFLKSSLNTSPKNQKEFQGVNTPQLVEELGILSDRIYGISINRASSLRDQIEKRKIEKETEKTMKVKTIKLKDLIVEEKQNKCIFKEKPLVTEEHKDDYGNFEMDQNLNYVQNIPNFQQDNDHHISTIGVQSKDYWLSSQENASKENSTIKLKSDLFSISANSTRRKKSDVKYSKLSIESQKPKGVYEQILSLYSTAKLLALKRQFN